MRALNRAWPALPLGLLLLAAIVVVIGVVAAPAPTDTRRVEDAVHDLARAVRETRGEDACALLTPAARRVVAARTGTLSCAATLRSFGLGVDAAALEASRVTGVTVTGDRAMVAREQLLQPDGTPFGRGVALQRDADGWLVAGLG